MGDWDFWVDWKDRRMWPTVLPIMLVTFQFHAPTEQYGTLMSLADVIGFHNVRTSMPEYIRIIERGTMRTFGKDVVGVAAFFSGFVSIIVYFVWWYVGKLFSTVKYMKSI